MRSIMLLRNDIYVLHTMSGRALNETGGSCRFGKIKSRVQK